MKVCSRCLELKSISSYHKDKYKLDGLYGICKCCRSVSPTKTKDPMKLKIQRDRTNTRRRTDPVTIENNRKYKIEYRARNSDVIRTTAKRRLDTNLNAKLSKILRNRFWSARRYGYKRGSAIRDLGCTLDDFKLYMESLFQFGMTWDNQGLHGWHIDHIKPLSKFDLSDEAQVKNALHYTNLQPLWAIDNLKKWNH